MEDGTIVDELPYDLTRMPVTPVYKTFKGWNQDLAPVKSFEEMPVELAEYISFIENISNG